MQANDRYVIKFGLAHSGPRLDYHAIFEPLGVKSIEVATNLDGLNYIMLTTLRGRSCPRVMTVIREYNATDKAAAEGMMDLVHIANGDELPLITFCRAVPYHEHEICQYINAARTVAKAGDGGVSAYWFWKHDGSHLSKGSILNHRCKRRNELDIDLNESVVRTTDSKRRRVPPKVEIETVEEDVAEEILDSGDWNEFQVLLLFYCCLLCLDSDLDSYYRPYFPNGNRRSAVFGVLRIFGSARKSAPFLSAACRALDFMIEGHWRNKKNRYKIFRKKNGLL